MVDESNEGFGISMRSEMSHKVLDMMMVQRVACKLLAVHNRVFEGEGGG